MRDAVAAEASGILNAVGELAHSRTPLKDKHLRILQMVRVMIPSSNVSFVCEDSHFDFAAANALCKAEVFSGAMSTRSCAF